MNATPATADIVEIAEPPKQPASGDGAGASTPSTGGDTAVVVGAVATLTVAALSVVWLVVSLLVGLANVSSWDLQTLDASTAVDASARIETAASSLVGPVEDRYGVGGPDQQTLRIARHCDGEWSITYPRSAAEWLPSPASPVTVRVAAPGSPTIDTAASIAGNGLTVRVPASERLDVALFANIDATVTVDAADGRRLSLTETDLRAGPVTLWPLRWPNPLFYLRGSVHDPLSALADVCS